MDRIFAVLAFIVLMAIAGCSTNNPPPDEAAQTPQPEEAETPLPSDQARGVGTITFFDLEGGFYGLVADDGARYDPMNLDEAFKEDGLRVRFHVRLRTGVMTIRQWGKPAEILEITRLEER